MKFNANVKNRFRPVFWGLVFITAAVLLILQGANVELGEGINAWRIIVGTMLVGWLIYEIIQVKIPQIFFPLAFLFLVFEKPISHAAGRGGEQLISSWIVIIAALFLTIGFGVLLPGKNWASKKNFTRKSVYLNAEKDLAEACIHDNLGTTHVYVTNRDAYNGTGVITVRDNLGVVNLHLPGTWLVALQESDNLGKVIVPEQTRDCTYGITLVVKDNLGTVSVIFE